MAVVALAKCRFVSTQATLLRRQVSGLQSAFRCRLELALAFGRSPARSLACLLACAPCPSSVDAVRKARLARLLRLVARQSGRDSRRRPRLFGHTLGHTLCARARTHTKDGPIWGRASAGHLGVRRSPGVARPLKWTRDTHTRTHTLGAARETRNVQRTTIGCSGRALAAELEPTRTSEPKLALKLKLKLSLKLELNSDARTTLTSASAPAKASPAGRVRAKSLGTRRKLQCKHARGARAPTQAPAPASTQSP